MWSFRGASQLLSCDNSQETIEYDIFLFSTLSHIKEKTSWYLFVTLMVKTIRMHFHWRGTPSCVFESTSSVVSKYSINWKTHLKNGLASKRVIIDTINYTWNMVAQIHILVHRDVQSRPCICLGDTLRLSNIYHRGLSIMTKNKEKSRA